MPIAYIAVHSGHALVTDREGTRLHVIRLDRDEEVQNAEGVNINMLLQPAMRSTMLTIEVKEAYPYVQLRSFMRTLRDREEVLWMFSLLVEPSMPKQIKRQTAERADTRLRDERMYEALRTPLLATNPGPEADYSALDYLPNGPSKQLLVALKEKWLPTS